MDEPIPTFTPSNHDRIRIVICSLPVLSKEDVPLDDSCPICLVSFQSVLDEKVGAVGDGMDGSNPTVNNDNGVTMLVRCGHMFCRKDLSEWIRNMHGTCPTCRQQFLDIHPPSDSDDESSDGGEYIPNLEDDEEDDDDAFPDSDVGAVEGSEFDLDEMDVGLDTYVDDMEAWADNEGEETEEWESEPSYGEGGSSSGIDSEDAEVELELELGFEVDTPDEEIEVVISVNGEDQDDMCIQGPVDEAK